MVVVRFSATDTLKNLWPYSMSPFNGLNKETYYKDIPQGMENESLSGEIERLRTTSTITLEMRPENKSGPSTKTYYKTGVTCPPLVTTKN